MTKQGKPKRRSNEEKPMSIILKSLLCLTLLTLAGLCNANAQVSPKPPGDCLLKNGLTAREISDVLAAHNKVRVELHLSPLTWNCELADFAQAWAKNGVFDHREGTDFGENLFVATSATVAPGAAIQQWLAEKPFWNNQRSTCQAGTICGHYTQLVWRKTTEIGCGINRNTPGQFKTLMVCNYNPAGNFNGPAY
jgi:Cysteine-rich secretory protein family